MSEAQIDVENGNSGWGDTWNSSRLTECDGTNASQLLAHFV